MFVFVFVILFVLVLVFVIVFVFLLVVSACALRAYIDVCQSGFATAAIFSMIGGMVHLNLHSTIMHRRENTESCFNFTDTNHEHVNFPLLTGWANWTFSILKIYVASGILPE